MLDVAPAQNLKREGTKQDMATIEDIRTNMKSMGLSDAAIEAAIKAVVKTDAGLAKAQAEAKEAERLAAIEANWAPIKTVLDGFAAQLLQRQAVQIEALGKVGIKSFTIRFDAAQSDKPVTGHESSKAKSSGSTGGNGGTHVARKDAYGLTPTEVFEKWATDAERDALAKALASEKAGEKAGNSASWGVKDKVYKRIIAAGMLKANGV